MDKSTSIIPQQEKKLKSASRVYKFWGVVMNTKSRHDANFVATSGTASADKFGITMTLGKNTLCVLSDFAVVDINLFHRVKFSLQSKRATKFV